MSVRLARKTHGIDRALTRSFLLTHAIAESHADRGGQRWRGAEHAARDRLKWLSANGTAQTITLASFYFLHPRKRAALQSKTECQERRALHGQVDCQNRAWRRQSIEWPPEEDDKARKKRDYP